MAPEVTHKLIFVFALTLVLVGACETPPPREHAVAQMERIVEDAVASQPDGQVPTAVADALLPSLALDSGGSLELEDDQRFDISVEAAPAQQFFTSLVEGTRYNMVVHPEVQGTVTLRLRDITIPQVMEAVRDVYGFEFVRTAYGFQVLPGRLQARIYQINFLNVRRSGASSSFVSTGTLTSGTSASSGGDETDADTSGGGGYIHILDRDPHQH